MDLSVIIPVFNGERYIARALRSVLEQECVYSFEVIVSDDGSTDSTEQICRTFGEKIQFVSKPKNCVVQGPGGSRNRGLLRAKGGIVCFLDADDWYLPGHLNKIKAAFDYDYDEVGFVFCRYLYAKEIEGKWHYAKGTYDCISKNDIKNLNLSRHHIVHTNAICIRRSVFGEIGVFNVDYQNGEDGDMWMRLSEKFSGKFSNHIGAVYRQHSDGRLTGNDQRYIDNCHLRIYEEALRRYGELRLENLSRLFEIRHLILHNKYRRSKFEYAGRFGWLILRYPISFAHWLFWRASGWWEEKSFSEWHEVEFS